MVFEVTDVPDNFKEWIKDNEERIKAAEERGKIPYFLKDNRQAVEMILNPKEEPIAEPKKTALEIATERHSARTHEDVERIQTAWNERRKQIESQTMSVDDSDLREIADALGIPQGDTMSFEETNELRGNPKNLN